MAELHKSENILVGIYFYFIYARRRCGVVIVNFEHISHLVLVLLLLTFNM